MAALIVGRPVFGMCKEGKRHQGTVHRQWWWDQEVDWDVAYEAATSREMTVVSDNESL